MARCGARKPEVGQALDVGEGREIDIGDARVEPRGRTNVATERLDGVAEAGAAAIELRSGVPHLEGRRRPTQRSVQSRELVPVITRRVTLEGAAQVVAVARAAGTFDDVELALEVAVARQLPRLAGEEQLAHALEVHARLDVVALLGPMRGVDGAPGDA